MTDSNISGSSSRDGRAEIEQMLTEYEDLLDSEPEYSDYAPETIARFRERHQEWKARFAAARAALLEYVERAGFRSRSGGVPFPVVEELGHIRWATRAAGLNEDIAGPIIEKLRRLSSPSTEEPK